MRLKPTSGKSESTTRMSNIIAFPALFPMATASEEISSVLAALTERPPSANDALFAEKVTEIQTKIATATTDDARHTAHLLMGILLGLWIVDGQSNSAAVERTA
ncbi:MULTISPECIES: hypothetical protein [unclassified Rhizobium]|uniref:hypothetical protein n=1 Tax=unclassified Rhizobium TaxID=2613769 RepID=UPI001C83DD13|nr:MULTISPECIES: hypothetical protein [unclassified Rhizobium]MBX5165707.1 hypothetical protein [Rhizobium sp. NZLR4b]MBX5209132.1 hypothetical protein [Rhizobium sp. NZLR11]